MWYPDYDSLSQEEKNLIAEHEYDRLRDMEMEQEYDNYMKSLGK